MKKPPKVVWVMTDAMGLTGVYSMQEAAVSDAKAMDRLTPDGPHVVHRYVPASPKKAGVKRG